MFFTRIKKSLKVVTLLTFLGAILFGSFCTGMLHAQSMHDMEQKEGFSIMQKNDTCCGSAYSERIALWQSITTSTFNDLRESVSLLGLLFTLLFSYSFHLQREKGFTQKLLARIRWLITGTPHFQLFSSLKLAFADGLLHPKTF